MTENPQDFFKGKKSQATQSKLIQINNTQIYVIGGRPESPSLLTHDYDVWRSCLRVDLESATVEERASLVTGRCFHAVVSLGNYIFVLGGFNQNEEEEKSVEKYDS